MISPYSDSVRVWYIGSSPGIRLRQSVWAWFGRSLEPHQTFWVTHQTKTSLEGILLKGPGENTVWVVCEYCRKHGHRLLVQYAVCVCGQAGIVCKLVGMLVVFAQLLVKTHIEMLQLCCTNRYTYTYSQLLHVTLIFRAVSASVC